MTDTCFEISVIHFFHEIKMVNQEEISRIGLTLNDVNHPLKERFRALFTLKNLGGKEAIENFSKSRKQNVSEKYVSFFQKNSKVGHK